MDPSKTCAKIVKLMKREKGKSKKHASLNSRQRRQIFQSGDFVPTLAVIHEVNDSGENGSNPSKRNRHDSSNNEDRCMEQEVTTFEFPT